MDGQRNHRPTQLEIARHAGVSQATVSAVVNSGPTAIAPATRERVLEAIRELGYAVNPAAQRLRGKSGRTLGLYTFESVFPVDQHDFYYPFLVGAESAAAELGYDLLLFTSGADSSRSLFSDGQNRLLKADACVLIGRHVDRQELARLLREDFPFVFIGRREVDHEELMYIAPDYARATSRTVRELAALGHQRIRLIRRADGDEPTTDRTEGFLQGMEASDLPVTDADIITMSADEFVTPELLTGWVRDGVTACVIEPTEDDRIARELDAVARAAGLTIPGDLSVAFLGEVEPVDRDRIWSSFSISRTEMGREAIRMLAQRLENGEAETRQVLLECVPQPGNSISLVAGRRSV